MEVGFGWIWLDSLELQAGFAPGFGRIDSDCWSSSFSLLPALPDTLKRELQPGFTRIEVGFGRIDPDQAGSTESGEGTAGESGTTARVIGYLGLWVLG